MRRKAARPASNPTPSLQGTLEAEAPAPECVGAAVLLELGAGELEDWVCPAIEAVVVAATELVAVAVDTGGPDVVVRRVAGVVTVVLIVPVSVGEPVAVVMSVGTEFVAAPGAEAAEAAEVSTAAGPDDAVSAAKEALWREAERELRGPSGIGMFAGTDSVIDAGEAAAFVAVFAATGL